MSKGKKVKQFVKNYVENYVKNYMDQGVHSHRVWGLFKSKPVLGAKNNGQEPDGQRPHKKPQTRESVWSTVSLGTISLWNMLLILSLVLMIGCESREFSVKTPLNLANTGDDTMTMDCPEGMLRNEENDMCEPDVDKDMVLDTVDVDDNNNGLIEIRTIEEFNNIRYSLDGTRYDTDEDDSAGDGPMMNGTGSNAGCKEDACNGYELLSSLDFDTDGDNSTTDLDLAANVPTALADDRPAGDGDDMFFNEGAGFSPIGCGAMTCTDEQLFSGIFQGNGFIISNLYIQQGFGDTDTFTGTGLFNSRNATFRNIALEDVHVSLPIGATSSNVGALSGLARGVTVINCHVSGNVYSSNPTSMHTGGLIGAMSMSTGDNSPVVIASSFNGNVFGGNSVGGLIGSMQNGQIIASFVTGGKVVVEGDNGGGLLGSGQSTATPFDRVIASYSTNEVLSVLGMAQVAGGLVGRFAAMESSINASYASGAVTNFMTMTGFPNGSLVGGPDPATMGDPIPNATLVASYGFGTVTNNGAEIPNTVGTPGALVLGALTLATVSADDPNPWHDPMQNTEGAWLFGTGADPLARPMLRYADYDGATTGGRDYCALYGMRQFDGMALVCGTDTATLLPGQ